jgi:hypothetical protein
MAGYQRKTALSPSEVMAEAEEFIPEMVGFYTGGLRTSRLDYEVRRLLHRLPYEPGDRRCAGSGKPT